MKTSDISSGETHSELPGPIPLNQTPGVHRGSTFITLRHRKPCQYNNKFDCNEENGYKIPQDATRAVQI